MEQQPPSTTSPRSQEEQLAADLNRTEGIRRHGPAFPAFAEAVGHLAAARDPELFERSLVGTWPTIDTFARDFAVESGLYELNQQAMPAGLRPYVSVDLARVADALRSELLVLEAGHQTWVFDVRLVVKTTVDETQLWAHSE